MLLFGLERILHFLRLSGLLTQVGETAQMQCSKSSLTFTVSYTNSLPYSVVLRIEPPFFFFYKPSITPMFLSWRISLKQLCDRLRNAIAFSSMLFDLSTHSPPVATLTFHDTISDPRNHLPSFSSAITLSNPEKLQDVGIINNTRFVSIDSQQFKHVVIEFRNIDQVDITFNDLQVTFSGEDKNITFKKEYGECLIGGVGVNEDTQLWTKLRPTTFFGDLSSLVERVWFYETSRINSAIYAPVDLNSRFEIYFPPLM